MATQTTGMDRLGTILLREGLITQDQLDGALQDSRSHGTRLGYSLIKLGFIQEEELTRMLSRQYRVPAVDIAKVSVDARILKLVPDDIAHKHLVLPLRRVGRTLTVATANPADPGMLDQLKFVTRHDIEPVVVGEFTLKKQIEKYYGIPDDDALSGLLDEIDASDIELIEEQEEEVAEAALQAQVEDAPVVKLIN
ncbi:MAG: type II secretion system protein GspE, partial [Gemmatimonadota bacterium]